MAARRPLGLATRPLRAARTLRAPPPPPPRHSSSDVPHSSSSGGAPPPPPPPPPHGPRKRPSARPTADSSPTPARGPAPKRAGTPAAHTRAVPTRPVPRRRPPLARTLALGPRSPSSTSPFDHAVRSRLHGRTPPRTPGGAWRAPTPRAPSPRILASPHAPSPPSILVSPPTADIESVLARGGAPRIAPHAPLRREWQFAFVSTLLARDQAALEKLKWHLDLALAALACAPAHDDALVHRPRLVMRVAQQCARRVVRELVRAWEPASAADFLVSPPSFRRSSVTREALAAGAHGAAQAAWASHIAGVLGAEIVEQIAAHLTQTLWYMAAWYAAHSRQGPPARVRAPCAPRALLRRGTRCAHTLGGARDAHTPTYTPRRARRRARRDLDGAPSRLDTRAPAPAQRRTPCAAHARTRARHTRGAARRRRAHAGRRTAHLGTPARRGGRRRRALPRRAFLRARRRGPRVRRRVARYAPPHAALLGPRPTARARGGVCTAPSRGAWLEHGRFSSPWPRPTGHSRPADGPPALPASPRRSRAFGARPRGDQGMGPRT